jgi:glutamate--cysteine ligase
MSEALTRETLLSVFRQRLGEPERIGIEVELASLDPTTGSSIPYEGPVGVRRLLEAFEREEVGEPIVQEGHLVGLQLADDGKITLEHGGAIEYCSPVAPTLVDLVVRMRSVLERLAAIARRVGVALVAGSNIPFNNDQTVNWMPKSRGKIMRDYFATLGDAGARGPTIMAHSLSTQVTLDYVSEQDLLEKLRTGFLLTPIVVALFANSPIADGAVSGALSSRTQHWLQTDASRCGFVPQAFSDTMDLDDFVDWALGVGMIYRAHGGRYVSAEGRPFATLLRDGFADGTRPTLEDWLSHLTQIWTDVRLREKLEFRAADGPPYDAIPVIPAFWTGLMYHPPSRVAVERLLQGYSLREAQAARSDAARCGLLARYGAHGIAELAEEVLKRAKEGLQARIAARLEHPAALTYLAPLEDVVRTRRTFAERCIDRWETEFRRSPAQFVEAFRISSG